MKTIYQNAELALIEVTKNFDYSIECFFNEKWVSVKQCDTLAAAKRAFKSFGGTAMTPREASISSLVEQAIVGNEMIAKGNNNTADHIEAADMKVNFADEVARLGSTCKALRAYAATWGGTRAAFIEYAENNGVNKSTAATQWAKGRK